MNRKKFIQLAGILLVSPLVLTQIQCSESSHPTTPVNDSTEDPFFSQIGLVTIKTQLSGKASNGFSGFLVPMTAIVPFINEPSKAHITRYIEKDGVISFESDVVCYLIDSNNFAIIDNVNEQDILIDKPLETFNTLAKLDKAKLIKCFSK